MCRIYNETVECGGHSPVNSDMSPRCMRQRMGEATHKHWPMWVLTRPIAVKPESATDSHTAATGQAPLTETDPRTTEIASDSPSSGTSVNPSADAPQGIETATEEIIAWSHIRAICWAPTACGSTGDVCLYVTRAWHGTGVAMLIIRKIRTSMVRYGFDSMTCWILGGNHRSLSLVRACRMQRWGCLPQAVRYGSRTYDLEIWGIRLNDPTWIDYMNRLDARYTRRERLQRERAALQSAHLPASTTAIGAGGA